MPDLTIASLQARTLEDSAAFASGPRVLVYTCSNSDIHDLHSGNVKIIELPCVAMLPPAFIDFALSRNLAEGVMVAGCAEGDCYYRLGDRWMRERLAGERDPYLRRRVDRARLAVNWLPTKAKKRRSKALEEFVASLAELPPGEPARRRRRG